MTRTFPLRIAWVVAALCAIAPATRAQPPARVMPAAPISVVTADTRRAMPAFLVADQQMIALDDLAALFDLSVRDDAAAGGVTVSCKGRIIALTPGQPLASVAGQLVSLPAPVIRDGKRWLVPLDFITRALAPALDTRVELRKSSRLLLIGDLRVPRIVVRSEFTGRETRVVLEVLPATPFTVTQDIGRLLVRFDANLVDATVDPAPAQGPVVGIRLTDTGTAFAIDLGSSYASHRTSTEPGDTPQSPAKVVVDVMSATPLTSPRLGQVLPATPPSTEPRLPVPQPPGIRTVVVDPGHGGDETGAIGSSGTFEKDVTLAVSRRLKAALEARLGVRALLTRDGDELMTLDDRAAFANSQHADLFISVHANAAPRRAVHGAEVYFLTVERATSETQQPGAAPPATLPVFGGGSREIDVILWEMAQTRHLAQSAKLAGYIEEAIAARLQVGRRPVQQAPFRVLVGAAMPAVLVEMGYLSNPDEEQRLASAEYQDVVVQALVDAIERFRQELERAR